MKILRYLDPEGRIHHGEQKADNHVERLEGDLFAGLAPTGEPARVQKILAPLVPVAILCIGLNYKHHAAESGMKAPELPILFVKGLNTLQNPGDPIEIPTRLASGEVELAFEKFAFRARIPPPVVLEDRKGIRS